MNEFIERLAEKADELADRTIQMPGEYHPDWRSTRDEAFARLIIKECQSAFFTDECYTSDLADIDYCRKIDTIKGHFMKHYFLP